MEIKYRMDEYFTTIFNRLTRSTPFTEDVLISLDNLYHMIDSKVDNKFACKTLLKKKVFTVLEYFLADCSLEILQNHDAQAVSLAERCLKIFATVITNCNIEYVAEEFLGSTTLTTLQILGFGQRYDNGTFRHSYPRDTMSYLRRFEGKILRADLTLFNTSKKSQSCDVAPIYCLNTSCIELGERLCSIPSSCTTFEDVKKLEKIRITYWKNPNLCFIQKLDDISKITFTALQNISIENLVHLQAKPKVGDNVILRYEGSNWPHQSWIRGKVTKCHESVTIYAIDFGFEEICDWKKLYVIPHELSDLQPVAIPCYFDVFPPIPSENIIKFGVKFLLNISKVNTKLLADCIIKSKNLDVIIHLLDCKFRNADQVLAMLVNLCADKSTSFQLDLMEHNTISKLFSTFRTALQEWNMNKSAELENKLTLSLQLMETLVLKSDDTKFQFVEQQGLENISRLLRMENVPKICQTYLVRILYSIFGVSGNKIDKNSQMKLTQGEMLERGKSWAGITIIESNRTLTGIDADLLEDRVCALANHSSGGRIIFGIAKSGNIIGMRLSRKDRDDFRLGVDKLISQRIKPMIPPHRIEIASKQVAGLNHDLYILSIQVTGMPMGIHCNHDNRYLVASDSGHVREMSPNELKDFVVDKEETKYLNEIHLLRATIQKLKDQQIATNF